MQPVANLHTVETVGTYCTRKPLILKKVLEVHYLDGINIVVGIVGFLFIDQY